jgi:methylglutamate dehydrogenase subunit C
VKRSGPSRVAPGLLTAAGQPVDFRFDGRRMQGLAGDTLASALLANGTRIVGRSFKYHRPRGIVTAGAEEPCALVDVVGTHGREPNRLATTVELHQGLSAESQNRWPSLSFDVMAINRLFARFLPAGFYYKTFMAPGWAWERLYEPLIRRAAGLGRLESVLGAHPAPAETVHQHADILVIGAGPAGLAAAQRLGAAGLRVLLVDQDVVFGGGALLDVRWSEWREALSISLAALNNVTCLTRTAVFGAYGHGVFGALETLAPAAVSRFGGLRERLRIIRVKRVVIATGAVERLIAFPGNDLPGVMLAGAGLSFLRRFGVAVGRRPAYFVNSDEAYETVFALADAGIDCAGVIDVRANSAAADQARRRGIEVHGDTVVEAAMGHGGIRQLSIAARNGTARRVIAADALLMSGGYSPATALASQLGAALLWDESIAGFVPVLPPRLGRIAGAVRGCFGLAAAARDGDGVAEAIVADLGASNNKRGALPEPPPDPQATPIAALWETGRGAMAFVDLQNDVTAEDVRLAHREGYEHVEHMKRFTTHGMATDQGRIGGLVGAAVLAQARGLPVSEVGQSKPRPFVPPVSFAALAGGEVGQHYKPRRLLPLHDWHEAAGANFVSTGLWMRPLVYSRQGGWEPVLAEARAVRESVGVTDVSTLGKIDVQGADAARFLDFIYANTFSTLAVGRARYGIMLREDGMMLDDGTTSRLGPEHFIVTTTTANSAAVFEHMEFHLQATCPQFDVVLTDVADQWAQFAVAGPRAREVVAAIVADLDVSNAAFPFMATAEAAIANIRGRVFRISFSGELAYELSVPSADARTAWMAILDAGKRYGIVPYGLDALNTLRIEKGHVTGAELNGNTTADDLGFGRMLKARADFVGRTLAQRPGMVGAERQQLVGVRPIDRGRRLRNGAHIVAPEASAVSLGFVTSSTPSAAMQGWVGLALLARGRDRLGSQLMAASPLHAEHTAVEIVSPHMFDPESVRVRA